MNGEWPWFEKLPSWLQHTIIVIAITTMVATLVFFGAWGVMWIL
jgi:hypothetical protein